MKMLPDYNIDSDGDGKADLNIDTDNDGKPDLNLVILKEWKTSKCVEINGVKYSSGIKAKAKINIDLDGDKLPDIDTDNKGDFKPHLNISKDGKTAAVNIIKLHEWKPNKDYQSGTFRYDSIGNGKHDPRPELNIDSDDDGLADINIDLNHDGKADINIDLDGDLIPDIDIDSNGDGKGDVNVDTDGDGKADQNIIKINKWKPEHNVEGEIPYDTMTLEAIKEQENSGEIQKDANRDNVLENIGGALTGDTTNIMMYMGMLLSTMGAMLLIFNRIIRNNNK